MSKSPASRSITGAAFTLEALEPRLLLSATSLPEPDPVQPDTGSTSVLALAGVGHADLLSNPAENDATDLFGDYLDTPRLVLTSATLKDYEGQEDTVFGTSDLLTQVVVGDGTGDSVYLPGQNSLIYADSVDVSAPLVAQHLVITGDGSTVKLTGEGTIISTSNIINDAVEVSGNFGQSPVRSITSTGGVLTINGTLNGDNHFGALNGNENQGVDDVVLNATDAIFIRDAVGGISGNGLRHISINIITGVGVGNVTFNDTVTISGNLYIKKGQDVSFLRNVVIGGDLVIEDAADVRFDGTLTVGGSLRIMKAGNVTFAGNVAVSGNVTLGRPDLLANIGSVSFTSSARLDFGGHGAIYTAGNLSFGNNVGESVPLRPDSFTLAAGGNITFTSSASVLLDSTTAFIISKAGDISFGSNINTGNLTIGHGGNVTGNITFAGASVSVQSLDVTTSGAIGRVSIINNVTVGFGDATITANEISFGGSAAIGSVGDYASTLTLKPYDVARAIAVGTSATGAPTDIDDRLDLNGDDIKAILPTFAHVIFGDLYAGTGNVFIGNVGSVHSSHQFLTRTTIAGGAVTLTQNLDVAVSTDFLRIVARTGNITVNGVVNRGALNGTDLADETFAERNAWIRLEAAGDIIVNRAVYAATRISLTAGTDGTGSITINSTGSNSGSLQTINSAAGAQRIELVAGETSGNITLIDDVGATTLRAAGSASSIVLRANGGAISQTQGLLIANTLSVWARDNVSLRTDVNRIASQTINGEILPGGSGAQVTANMTGSVTTIFLTNGGTGYTTAPTVTLSAPPAGGTQATAEAVVVGGFVTAINILNAGSGYTTAPTVTISGGGGTGATALALTTPGALTSLSIVPGGNGSGFTTAPTITILGDGRSVATGTATIRGGVSSYLVTSGGSGYTTIGFTIPGTATIGSPYNLIGGQLASASVSSPGSTYSSAPGVTVSGNGTGAAVTAILNGNLFSVSGTAGSGYTYTPTVVVTGGAASQTINGLQIVGGGSVNIVNSGGITVANATTTPNSASTRGAFSLTTLSGDIALGYINTSTGAITLTSAGAITDADSGVENIPNLVTTGLVTLSASTGIGGYNGADIDITAGSLQATNSTSGDIVIQHAGLTGLSIVGTGVRTLGGNGSINIQSNALNSTTGTLTVSAPVSAHGSGNVRLQAVGTLSDIELSTSAADLSSGSGHITLVAERHLTTVAGTRIDTVGGSIFLEATTGAFTMADDSLATSGGGSIRAFAQSDVTLGGLHADTGAVSVISSGASILDAGDTHRDITGGLVRLVAFSGVGTAANPLEISADTLSASAAAAGINLRESDDVTIGATAVSTNRVNLTGTVSDQADASQSDLATTANGSVNFAAGGTILLLDGDADNHAVSASGSGLVYLSAGASIDARSDVISGSGSISLLAGDSISFAAGSDVTTAGLGTIDLLATLGSITQTNGAVATTAGGSLRAQAGTDVTVASFNVGTGNISIIAGGSILDGGDTHRDLVANAARLVAGDAAGAVANALETTLGTLSVSAGAGGIHIAELDALLVDSVTVTVDRVNGDQTTTPVVDAAQADLVTTDNGSIKVVTGGDLTLNKGDADDEAVSAHGSGTITLDVTGVLTMSDGTIAGTGTGAINFTASDSIHLSIVSSTSGDFTITSGAAITDNLTGEAANLRTSGLAALDAKTGVGGIGDADIDTAVGSITARNRDSGDIVIEEADAVTIDLAGLINDVAAAHVILSTLAGTITALGPVTATGSGRIRLSAAGASSDIIGSAAISTGIGGHVTLLAARSLTLNTGASVVALGTGTLDLEATTGSIQFADNVAATTGSGDIRLLAAQNVTLTGLATTGSVTVQATTGSISDAGESRRDIIATNARLVAGVGIGATGALETTLDTLAASATTGGVAIAELNDLVIGSVAAISVNRVALDATVSSVGDTGALTDVAATTGAVTISAGGALTLTDGSDADARAIETTTGDITLSAVGNVTFQASVVSTSGDISVSSSTAALVDDTADENALVVTTGLATLNAATGVGTANAGDIDTTVGSLRGELTTSGGFFVEETDTLVVHEDGIVTKGGSAPVSLVVATGALTIEGVITAHGTGNIHVNAKAGSAEVNAAVSSSGGHVTFLANGTIGLNADIASSGGGTLNVVSATGDITQLDGARVRTGTGDIRLLAAGSVALASLWTSGNASVTATTGAITDAGDTHVDAIANQLSLRARTSIATSANHLETTVTTLSAWAGGDIYLLESDGVTVDNTHATVRVVLADASAEATASEGVLSDLVTTNPSNGNIVLRSTGGDIVLNDGTAGAAFAAVTAHGSGSILIDALSGSLDINSAVRSSTGHVTLKADDNIDIAAGTYVSTASAGTVSIDAETGSLTMGGTTNVTATGSSARLRAKLDITVGNVTADDVSLYSESGSIINAAGSTKNVTAENLRLQANGSIGASDRHLTTDIDNVTALASTGSIFLTEDNGATVRDVEVSVTEFNPDATTTTVTDDAQSDFVTGEDSNGHIVLVATNGDITLTDALDGDGVSVNADGSGNILIDALAGSLFVNASADILGGTGHVTLKAASIIVLGAEVDVATSSAGTVSLDAVNGFLLMDGSADILAADSSARLRALGDIIVGNVTANDVSIRSTAGSIINAEDSTKNVTAENLRLQASGSIGASDRHLTTNIDNVTALASTGSIFLTEDNGATVRDVEVSVTDFTSTAGTAVVTDLTQSDLTTGANGHIVLVATQGDITLNDGTAPAGGNAVVANGTGNILINAAAGSITANADIRSGTGHITLLANNSINLTANVDVVTTGSGTMDIGAATGSFVMSPAATLNTVNGDIRITAGNDVLDQVVIGDITASNANVSIVTTGSVLDADDASAGDDSDIDITARGLRIDAGKGVGLLSGNSLTAPVNAIETTVGTLSVHVRGSDGINITETDGVAINDVVSLTDGTKSVSVQTVQANATTVTTTEVTQSDLVTTNTNGANGSIVLRTLAGDITLSEGTATADLNTDASVVAHGSGNILIQAIGEGTSIIANANADIESSTGHITLKAARTINLGTNVDVTTAGSGTQDIVATTGSFVMSPTATLNTVNGDIRITAGDDVSDQVVIGDITASNANVSIVTTGSVLDADDASAGDDSDIDITARGLRIDAGKGVGLLAGNSLSAPVNAIETTVDTLSVHVRGSDGINITETDAVAINDVVSLTDGTKSVSVQTVAADATTSTTTEVTQSDLVTTATNGVNGSIVLRTLAGDITLSEGTATADLNTDASVVAHGSGNILIQAIGEGTSIIANANADIESSTGHITLKADENITLAANVDVATASVGTISIDAETGYLLMAGTANVTATGSSARLRAEGDITVGNVTATNVSIDSDAGSILNAAGSTKNVTATNLRLQAQNSIGASDRHLTTNIDNVTALASTGSIFVTEDNGATVRDVAVTVQDVLANATTTAVNDAAQSDLTTGTNGHIVLVATQGDITLNDGTDLDGNAVVAGGSGSILIDAVAGSITANSDIRSTTGHITLKADDTIALTANVDVVTASAGTVSIDAETGTLTMAGSANVTATGSSARLRAQGNITVGNVTATNVSIDSDAGSILNAAGSTKNVTATNLRLQAQNSIGASDRHLTTNITNVSALASTGSINLTEDNGATVRDVAVSVTEFNSTAGTAAVDDAAQSDLTTGTNGHIILVAKQGDITLNDGTDADGNAVVAGSSGSILIDANAGSITANSDIRSGTGHITLKADDNIALTANVDVVTASAGTVSIDAETGTLTMAGSANVVATGSSARLRAQGNITVGNVTATNVSIDSDAGSILNAAGSTKNVTATNLRLQAQNSIGASDRHLTTNITNVSALASSGSINLTEDNGAIVRDVAVSVTDFTSTAGTTAVNDAAQSDLTTGANGHIILVATLGDITLNDGTDADGNAVVAGGSGSILIDALAGSITANSDIRNGTGHVTIKAAQNIAFTATADLVTGGAGTVSITATTGSVTQADNSRITSASGDIRVGAATDITVGGITTAANVSLLAGTGSIFDAGDAFGGADIIASGLRAVAGLGIGSAASPLETTIGTLAARATSGGIHLRETDAVVLGTVSATVQQFGASAGLTPVADAALAGVRTTAGNGVLDLRTTAGAITVANASGTHGSGSINLVAGGATGNVVFGDVLSTTTGSVTIDAGARIRETTTEETPVIVTGGVLTLKAVTGIGETGRADLDVSAPTLSFVNGGVGQVYLKSHSADATLTGGSLVGAGSLIFTQVTGDLDITGPVSVAGGTATFRVPGALTLTNAPISATGGMTIQATTLAATASDLTSTSGQLRVAASGGILFDAASAISGADVLLVSSGDIALAQVDATGLLDIRAGGDLTTVDNAASLAAAQLRLAVGGDAGTPSSPLRVESDASDITVAGSINIVFLNDLGVGRGGINFDTDEDDEQVIVVENGGTIGTIGGKIVDHGSGTLRFESDGSLALAAQIVSIGGDIVIDAKSITDASPDEAALLSAVNGRITLITESGIGSTGAGDIDFVSSEIVATTQTGDIQLEALGSVSVVGTGLVIADSNATGSIGLTVSTGNLHVPAAVTNAGSGGVELFVTTGTFTMSNLAPITTGVGAITIQSFGTMSVGRIVSTSGIVSLMTKGAITTVASLNFPNITIHESTGSSNRPFVSFSTSINIIIDAFSVLALTPYIRDNFPEYEDGVEIFREGSDDIDMSVYSDVLVGN